jgi:hypothetical protein
VLRNYKNSVRDQLLAGNDWNEAGHAYATEHDRYHAAVHEYTRLFYQMFYEIGPQADSRRTRALPLIAQDLSRIPDGIVSGPEIQPDV